MKLVLVVPRQFSQNLFTQNYADRNVDKKCWQKCWQKGCEKRKSVECSNWTWNKKFPQLHFDPNLILFCTKWNSKLIFIQKRVIQNPNSILMIWSKKFSPFMTNWFSRRVINSHSSSRALSFYSPSRNEFKKSYSRFSFFKSFKKF